MSTYNIYVIGVGGQGIGLLSGALTRAIYIGGQKVKSVDTHGLAQRGGVVDSCIRIGQAFSPLIPENKGHLVLSLELHEALRGVHSYLQPGGNLVYSPTSWQPLQSRQGGPEWDPEERLLDLCWQRGIRAIRAQKENLKQSTMSNVVILATLAREGIVPGVEEEHYRKALSQLLPPGKLEENLAVFSQVYEGDA